MPVGVGLYSVRVVVPVAGFHKKSEDLTVVGLKQQRVVEGVKEDSRPTGC